MTAIPLTAHGGPDILHTQRLPVPPVGDGDVLIRVAAAGVNAPDISQRKGFYDPPPGASPHLGLEVSGEIAAMGAAATGWAIGDKVVALCNGGGYAEYVSVPFGQVLPLPANWSLVEGAALPETWFTVTQTLVMRAGIEKGMDVLIHGAAGGIGGAAIQIVTLLGARAIGVVSNEAKARYAMHLGAVATIEHTSEDIVERTMALTGGKGADRILDIVGGEMTAKNIAASARFGHIVQVSTIGEPEAKISLRTLMAKQMTLSGSTLRPQTPAVKAAIAERMKTDLWPALQSPGFARPQIRRFALADAAEAHRAMEERGNMGKILLVTSHGASLTD